MTRFATLAAFVSALTAIAAATPIVGEETHVLEKRITHTGQVGFSKPCADTHSSCWTGYLVLPRPRCLRRDRQQQRPGGSHLPPHLRQRRKLLPGNDLARILPIRTDGGSQWMQITNPATGISQYAKTVDECEGCGQYDIGMSCLVSAY